MKEAEALLGVDPGLTNIGVSLYLPKRNILKSAFIPINIPIAVKRQLGDKKQEKTNWKLKQVYNRAKQTISTFLQEEGLDGKDVMASIESYVYRPMKPGKGSSFNNAAYDTVAAVAMIKAIFFELDIEFEETMSTQMRRILTWQTEGFPRDELDKAEVEEHVKKVLGKDKVNDILSEYAKGNHEHVVDSMAFAYIVQHKEAYQKYMKIPLKKRKKMLEEANATN